MAAARHRAPARQASRWLVPGGGIASAWLALRAPLGMTGFAVMLALGIATALFWPLALLLLVQAPGALVPPRMRMWRRRGKEDRPHIPGWLRRLVYAADGYACCYCHGSWDLQLDHLRPWGFGGRSTFWNFMTLCGRCNRVKSNYWRTRNGRVFYAPWHGAGDIRVAAAIARHEHRLRLRPWRYLRAALAL